MIYDFPSSSSFLLYAILQKKKIVGIMVMALFPITIYILIVTSQILNNKTSLIGNTPKLEFYATLYFNPLPLNHW